jgi:uncharacterized membrane protein YfcA
MTTSDKGHTSPVRVLRVLGALWLLLATATLAFYVARYISNDLDLRSFVIVIVYTLIGAVAGLFLVVRIPGRLPVTIAASLVYGLREFTYLFHTLPIPINVDSVRGFAILLFAMCTIVLVIAERIAERHGPSAV